MKQKLKTFAIPLIIIFIGIAALFIHQLLKVKETPQEEWSRSIPFDFSSEEKPLFFFQNENLFISNKNELEQFKVQDGLQIEKIKEIPTKVTRGFPFWTDGKQIIMMKNKNLISTINNKETVLDKNVTGIAVHNSHIIYWKTNKAYKLDPEDKTNREIFTFTREIHNAYIEDNGSAIFSVMKDDIHASLFYLDEIGNVLKEPFFTVTQATNDHVNGLTFLKQNNMLHILYNQQTRHQGSLSYKINKLSVSLENINNKIKPQTISFINKGSKRKLNAPRAAQIIELNGNKHILFTAESHKINANNAVSLYLAPLNEDTKLIAKPISTTKHFSFAPIKVSDKSIVWFDYDGSTYDLFGASQDKEVITASKEWTNQSVKEAINNAVLMLFSSLVTLLISFYWVLPSLFILILLYIFKPNIFDREGMNWVEYVSIIIFLLMPITFIGRAQSAYFHTVAPNYLSFSGSSWVWLLIISIVSSLIWKIGRNFEWGTFTGVFYFIGIYIFTFATTVGPYIFNFF